MTDAVPKTASSPVVPVVTSPPTSPPAKRVKMTEAAKPETTETVAAAATPVPSAPAAAVAAEDTLQIQKLSDDATLPTRGSAFAAGYDLYAARDTVLPARGKGLVDTDIAMAVPTGTYGRIAPRSGLAAKHFIDTGAGVIDADYRGQVRVLLFNHADTDFAVAKGDRIAQLILERIATPAVVQVAELRATERGAGGFGSTGGFGAAAKQ